MTNHKHKSSSSLPSYKDDNFDYRNPWETAKEGCWIIIKKEGSTSMSKIDHAEYLELEYALAKCYDIVVARIAKFFNDKDGYFSPSELALDTIKGLRELAIEQKNSYNKNTQGE